jgi:hypothetical protein
MTARADADALAAGLGEGAVVSETLGEVTIDVPRERVGVGAGGHACDRCCS